METYVHIDLHRTRDFSRKVNATFEFIKQNFKPLFKSIFFISGPPILIASVMIGSIFGNMIGFAQMSALGGADPEGLTNMFMSVNFWLQLILIMVFVMVSSVATIAIINNYVILYEKKGSNKIEVSEVWEMVRTTFFTYFWTIVALTFLAVIFFSVLALVIVGITAVVTWLGVILWIGYGLLFFYIPVSLSLVFFIRGYERAGIIESAVRSFNLTIGKWWSTFGLVMVLSMVGGIVSYVLLIPYYVAIFAVSLHDTTNASVAAADSTSAMQVINIVFFSVYYLVQMILYSLPYIGIAFQYFNLVEMKEARGLMSQIQTIGDTPAPAAPQDEHY